eukprot:scaffold6203_cov17-Tisochrysis_lutea.AAC.2
MGMLACMLHPPAMSCSCSRHTVFQAAPTSCSECHLVICFAPHAQVRFGVGGPSGAEPRTLDGCMRKQVFAAALTRSYTHCAMDSLISPHLNFYAGAMLIFSVSFQF